MDVGCCNPLHGDIQVYLVVSPELLALIAVSSITAVSNASKREGVVMVCLVLVLPLPGIKNRRYVTGSVFTGSFVCRRVGDEWHEHFVWVGLR